MGETLRMASERGAYTLTDRATWESWRGGLGLVPFPQQHELLVNPYSVIVPARSRNADAATRFARWLTGARAQSLIAGFRGTAAEPPFLPAAGEPAGGATVR
jgi:tungstate transport system substrate-binding protein